MTYTRKPLYAVPMAGDTVFLFFMCFARKRYMGPSGFRKQGDGLRSQQRLPISGLGVKTREKKCLRALLLKNLDNIIF